METSKKDRRKLGARRYADYSKEMLDIAVDLVVKKTISSYDAEKQFNIPRRTILNKCKNLHEKPAGRPTELSPEEETHLANVVNISAQFGSPLSVLDLRIVTHNYLEKVGKTHLFKGNIPGVRWARGFLKRHGLTQRATQNIKRSRASKTIPELIEYFRHLQNSLQNIPVTNILNFDETNLSDDPGSNKCIYKRGTKHPERVINSSKSSISIMFSASADGKCLPPYIVYKSDHLWTRWCKDGPKGARYNRTKSGWFDMVCFDDWFKTIVLPWANSLEGEKLIIGDNLASHLSVETIQLCQTHNIRFAFLPKNATHITQPLDVSFFGPMKRYWREILTKYKLTYGNITTINKCHFPQLLSELMLKIEMTQENNIRKGFEGCGIVPFDPSRVTSKIPDVQENNAQQFDVALLEYLQQNRCSKPIKTGCNNKLQVVPGKSISTEEAEELAKSKTKSNKKKTINKIEKQDGPEASNHQPSKLTIEVMNDKLLPNFAMKLTSPESLNKLCLKAMNIYLQCPSTVEFVHTLTSLQKNSEINTAFVISPQQCQKKKPKIKILSNVLIKSASTEKKMVLQNIKEEVNRGKRKVVTKVQTNIIKKKKPVYVSDSSSTSETSFHPEDESEHEDLQDFIESCIRQQDELEEENICPIRLMSPLDIAEIEDSIQFDENSWVIVKFTTKKSIKHFVGQVLSIQNKTPTVKFARRVKNTKKCNELFTYPNIEDVCEVYDLNDIVAVLPKPEITRRGQFIFNSDFSQYNLQ